MQLPSMRVFDRIKSLRYEKGEVGLIRVDVEE
jgi:hypothetical protein